ncbi:MAG TPA: CvpA family protein [Puia sp.]|nr:CvpA family protein [Puia sp.]
MWIDILFLIILLLAIFKGLQRGLIVAVFSVIALMAGIAAAIKLSAVVASNLKENINVSSKWLPFLAFVLVFIVVVLLVRWMANLIKAAADFALLGWVDKLGGMLLYAFIYLVAYSVLLFYAANLHLIPQHVISSSITYSFVEPWGTVAINAIGKIIPFFKNMFAELESFFGRLA